MMASTLKEATGRRESHTHKPSVEEPKYLVPSWDQIYDLMIDLSRKVIASKFKPDVIVGVSRGGWPPARVMSDLLSNSRLASIRVEFYKDIGVRSKKPKITQPVTSGVRGKRVLVVDDVADTGLSLKAVMDHMKSKGVKEARASTIYYKPQSVYTPHYYARQTSRWVVFPWERLETIRLLSRDVKRKNGDVQRGLIKELGGSGMPARLLKRLFKMMPEEKQ